MLVAAAESLPCPALPCAKPRACVRVCVCVEMCKQAAGADEAVLDCGALGGIIARVEFASLGPVPAGTCGSLTTSPLAPCAGVDLLAAAAAACEGKQSCAFSATAELQRRGLSADDAALCVHTELAEATAVALQARCCCCCCCCCCWWWWWWWL